MRQTQCVAYLVGADLTDASEHERCVGCGSVRAKEAGVDVVVSAGAMGIQAGHCLDDLTGPWIAERATNRPAALIAVLPLHYVITRVHWVHALGQILYAETALQAGAVEGF